MRSASASHDSVWAKRSSWFYAVKKGFTLIELLLVIGVTVIIFAIVSVVYDPGAIFSKSKATLSQADTVNLSNAVDQYFFDHQAWPGGIDTQARMIGTASTGCDVYCQFDGRSKKTASACLDLKSVLANPSLVMPIDAAHGGTEAKSNYALLANGRNAKLVVCDNICHTNCIGKECGDDDCGGNCGLCLTNEKCNAQSKCQKIFAGNDWTQSSIWGAGQWAATAMNADGQVILVADKNGYLYLSTDGGVNFSPRLGPGEKDWTALAISADGFNQYAAVNNGNIYQSLDRGQNWSVLTSAGIHYWRTISCDQTCTNIIALGWLTSTSGGYAVRSTNSGVSWTSLSAAPNYQWKTSASSVNGNYLIIASNNGSNGYVYTSTNGGANWVRRYNSARNWQMVDVSDDGLVMTAAATNDNLKISINSGQTWANATGGASNWYAAWLNNSGQTILAGRQGTVTLSLNRGSTWSTSLTEAGINFNLLSSNSNLSKVIVGSTESNGILKLSTDSRVSWRHIWSLRQRDWGTMAMNSDGSKIIAAPVGPTDYLYLSSDGGANWQVLPNAGKRLWRTVLMSADGTKLAAVAYNSCVFTSADNGQTWLSRSCNTNYQHLAGSADLNKLVVAGTSGNILYSDNNGSTWITASAPGSRPWTSLSISPNGQDILASATSTVLWRSINGGTTWTSLPTGGTRLWTKVYVAKTSNHWLAMANNDFVYLSTDKGQSWTTLTALGQKQWRSATASANGEAWLVAANNDFLFFSGDFGNSWQARLADKARNWYNVVGNNDFSKLVAGGSGLPLYISNQ